MANGQYLLMIYFFKMLVSCWSPYIFDQQHGQSLAVHQKKSSSFAAWLVIAHWKQKNKQNNIKLSRMSFYMFRLIQLDQFIGDEFTQSNLEATAAARPTTYALCLLPACDLRRRAQPGRGAGRLLRSRFSYTKLGDMLIE